MVDYFHTVVLKSLPRLQADKQLGWKSAVLDLSSFLCIKSELHCRRFEPLCNSEIWSTKIVQKFLGAAQFFNFRVEYHLYFNFHAQEHPLFYLVLALDQKDFPIIFITYSLKSLPLCLLYAR